MGHRFFAVEGPSVAAITLCANPTPKTEWLSVISICVAAEGLCLGCSGELFPLTMMGLPGSSTRLSVASGFEAPLLTLLRGAGRDAGTKNGHESPIWGSDGVILSNTPLLKATQCEGAGKHPSPAGKPTPSSNGKGAEKGGRIPHLCFPDFLQLSRHIQVFLTKKNKDHEFEIP